MVLDIDTWDALKGLAAHLRHIIALEHGAYDHCSDTATTFTCRCGTREYPQFDPACSLHNKELAR